MLFMTEKEAKQHRNVCDAVCLTNCKPQELKQALDFLIFKGRIFRKRLENSSNTSRFHSFAKIKKARREGGLGYF